MAPSLSVSAAAAAFVVLLLLIGIAFQPRLDDRQSVSQSANRPARLTGLREWRVVIWLRLPTNSMLRTGPRAATASSSSSRFASAEHVCLCRAQASHAPGEPNLSGQPILCEISPLPSPPLPPRKDRKDQLNASSLADNCEWSSQRPTLTLTRRVSRRLRNFTAFATNHHSVNQLWFRRRLSLA